MMMLQEHQAQINGLALALHEHAAMDISQRCALQDYRMELALVEGQRNTGAMTDLDDYLGRLDLRYGHCKEIKTRHGSNRHFVGRRRYIHLN